MRRAAAATLPQVKQVYKVGQNAPGFGRSLNGLFKQAITAGKRVRAETSISTGSVSVSSAAVELAQLKLPTRNWDDAKVCIIGAGKMSTLLVKHLLSKGCKEVTVLNRSLPRAQALADEYPDMKFNIHLMPDLMACVEASDVVFAASGSEELLITKADVERMGARGAAVGGVRRFVDISVPRNIAANINELAGHAIVYNVDDLKEVVAGNKEARAQVREIGSSREGSGGRIRARIHRRVVVAAGACVSRRLGPGSCRRPAWWCGRAGSAISRTRPCVLHEPRPLSLPRRRRPRPRC